MPLKEITKSRLLDVVLDDAAILEAVLLPTHEDKKEWIAANTVDFYNELTVLYGFCWENARAKNYKPGEGFPLNHQYQWATEQGKCGLFLSL